MARTGYVERGRGVNGDEGVMNYGPYEGWVVLGD